MVDVLRKIINKIPLYIVEIIVMMIISICNLINIIDNNISVFSIYSLLFVGSFLILVTITLIINRCNKSKSYVWDIFIFNTIGLISIFSGNLGNISGMIFIFAAMTLTKQTMPKIIIISTTIVILTIKVIVNETNILQIINLLIVCIFLFFLYFKLWYLKGNENEY